MDFHGLISCLTLEHLFYIIKVNHILFIVRKTMTSHTPSLYREYFTPEERRMLDATPRDDLTSEINLMRVLVARVLAASQQARDLALKQHAAMLAAFSSAGMVIARLVRLQLELHDPMDEYWAKVEEGKNIARQRMGVFDYFKQPIPSPASLIPSP